MSYGNIYMLFSGNINTINKLTINYKSPDHERKQNIQIPHKCSNYGVPFYCICSDNPVYV